MSEVEVKTLNLLIDLRDCAEIIERGDEPDAAYASDLRAAANLIALLHQEIEDRDESIARLMESALPEEQK